MIQEIISYKNVLDNISEEMTKSHFKKSYFIELLNMPAPTFYRKLKNNTFSVDEALTIAKVLEPEEAYILELKDSLLKGRKGETKKHSELMNELRTKYLSK
ncbi:MAG: hypothetical protein ACK5IC_06895 [Moheibacter sp.]